MRVGFIGDVVGRPGRGELEKNVKKYKDKFELDFVVANCENASGGFGLSPKNALEIFSYGIDCITGGNHSFDKKDILELMDTYNIIRPFNLYDAKGKGVCNLKKDDKNLSVINLLGIIGQNIAKSIFYSVEDAKKECLSKNILIDLHAEMTSEKMAFFWDQKGKVSAILGTHTHIGTDDLAISKGSAFVADVGLTGSREGAIGMNGDISVAFFKSGIKRANHVELSYKTIFQMIILDLVDGKCEDAFKLRVIDENEFIQRAIRND